MGEERREESRRWWRWKVENREKERETSWDGGKVESAAVMMDSVAAPSSMSMLWYRARETWWDPS